MVGEDAGKVKSILRQHGRVNAEVFDSIGGPRLFSSATREKGGGEGGSAGVDVLDRKVADTTMRGGGGEGCRAAYR